MKKNKINSVFAITFLIVAFVCGLPFMALGQQAQNILDKASQKYSQSNGISASFSLQVRSKASQKAEVIEGTIQMKGEKFTLKTPDSYTWYDGTTQWVYMEQTGEVNVSKPVGDELQLTNPAVLLTTYKKGFTTKYNGESTNQSGKKVFDITLLPKNRKSDISKIDLRIDKLTYFPASVTVTSKNGVSNTILISKLKTGVNQSASIFVFDERKFPGAEIIDLR